MQDNFEIINRTKYFNGYPVSDWTSCNASYCLEAKKQSKLVLINANKMAIKNSKITHIATLNFTKPLCPKCIQQTFNKIKRKLRTQQVICHWVIEINTDNSSLVHYHLTIVDGDKITLSKLHLATNDLPVRVYCDYIKNQRKWINYVFKTALTKSYVAGLGHEYNASKRRLFLPKTGIQKCGSIGAFWCVPKRDLWEEIKLENQQSHNGQTEETLANAELIYDMVYSPLNPSNASRNRTLKRLNWVFGWFNGKLHTEPHTDTEASPEASPEAIPEAITNIIPEAKEEEAMKKLQDLQEYEEPKTIIKHLIQAKSTLSINAPQNTYKSWLLFDMALCVANGKQWLGYDTTKTKTLLISMDFQNLTLLSRLCAITRARQIEMIDNLVGVEVMNLRGYPITNHFQDELTNNISNEYGLIVIDPMWRIGVSSPKFNLDKLAKDTGSAIAYACEVEEYGRFKADMTIHLEKANKRYLLKPKDMKPFGVSWKHPVFSRV